MYVTLWAGQPSESVNLQYVSKDDMGMHTFALLFQNLPTERMLNFNIGRRWRSEASTNYTSVYKSGKFVVVVSLSSNAGKTAISPSNI